jgi:hypothetical protein
MKRKTHTQVQKEKIEQVKKEVIELLKITEQDYHNLLFENAYSWANEHYGSDSITNSSFFWSCWKSFYYQSNKLFLNRALITVGIEDAEQEILILNYKEHHLHGRFHFTNDQITKILKELKNESQLQLT